jgi:SsrA-binding protein
MGAKSDLKLIAQNRRARHDYEISATYECGLVLKGSEVKSLREGKVQLREAYARIEGGEAWVFQMHIAPWSSASSWDRFEPDRKRKLLLHLKEIDELMRKTERDSFTLVPLSIYFKEGKAKLELALARGRKRQDKRAAIAERDSNREIERQVAQALRHGKD